MIISQRCKYALKAVLELSVRQTQQLVKIQEIADAQGIPTKFLEAILNDLRVAGVVESKRGSSGGYLLTRRPQEITVGEVVTLIQGPVESSLASVDVTSDTYGERALDKLWRDVAMAVNQVYDKTTFADLIEAEAAAKGGAVNYII